jgi:hypothetical protein
MTHTMLPPVLQPGSLAIQKDGSVAVVKEWITVREATTYSALSKPHLYQLMAAGKIKNVSLRERGKIKGKRLIFFDSLRNFLESHAKGGESVAAA